MPLFVGAETVAAEAAAKLVEMQSASLRTERKDLLDIVTEADLASEAIVISGLKRLTPNAAFLAEESGASGNASSERWIIDPLDGTINYARGLPWFSVTMAYEIDGEVTLGLVNAPKSGLTACYVRGEAATVDGISAQVSETRSLSDAVISVVLTSHFSREDVRRTARIVEQAWLCRPWRTCRGFRRFRNGVGRIGTPRRIRLVGRRYRLARCRDAAHPRRRRRGHDARRTAMQD